MGSHIAFNKASVSSSSPPLAPAPYAAEDQPHHARSQPQHQGSPSGTPGGTTAAIAAGTPTERPNLSVWLEQLEELQSDAELKWGMQPREAPAAVGMDEGRRDFVDAVRRCLLLYAQVRGLVCWLPGRLSWEHRKLIVNNACLLHA